MSSQTVFRFTSRDGIDGLQEFQEPIPILAEDEVLVKVRSVALNFRDIAIASSAYTLPVKDRVVPCSDMAGEVVRVGALVSSISLGDHVIAPMGPSQLSGRVTDPTDTFGALRDGMLREYVALPANVVIKLPKSPHSLAQWAALVCTGSTVWNSFYGSTALKPGETVLFLGSGGVSLTGLAFAKAAGATTIVTSSSDAKLEYVKDKLGADFTINYETYPNWAAEVQRITNGRGVDHVLEVGGPRTIGQSIESVAFGGVVSVIGFVAGASGVPLGEVPDVAMLALAKACTIRGVLGGTREHLEEAVRLVGSRAVSIPVDKTFSFNRDGILAALTHLSAGKHIGKVCINLD